MLAARPSHFRLALLASTGLLAAACNSNKLVHVPGSSGKTEVFSQQSASKIDILWVIDNSGSMAPYLARVAASFQQFINEFDRGAVDYRMGITTLDLVSNTPGARGTLYGTPSVISSTDDDPLSEFQTNVQVGATGDSYDEGLTAAKLTLDNFTTANAPILAARTACEQACNGLVSCVTACDTKNEPAFLRPDAYLYVVFVTNGEDNSEGDEVYFARYFQTVKGLGNALEVQVSAICGNVAQPTCPDAMEGTKYMNVAQLTGGVVGSICDSSFDQDLQSLATNAVGLKRHYLLGGVPKVSTLQITIAYRCDTDHSDPVLASCASINDTCTASSTPDTLGILCTPTEATQVTASADDPDGFTHGWSYQCSDNSLYFHADSTADSVPGLRSQISVSYTPAATSTSGCTE